jgi:hypothetical protein
MSHGTISRGVDPLVVTLSLRGSNAQHTLFRFGHLLMSVLSILHWTRLAKREDDGCDVPFDDR